MLPNPANKSSMSLFCLFASFLNISHHSMKLLLLFYLDLVGFIGLHFDFHTNLNAITANIPYSNCYRKKDVLPKRNFNKFFF